MPVAQSVCACTIREPKLETPAAPQPQDCIASARGQMEMVGLGTACSTHMHWKGELQHAQRPTWELRGKSLDSYMDWGLQSMCRVCPQGSTLSQPASSSWGFQWRSAQIWCTGWERSCFCLILMSPQGLRGLCTGSERMMLGEGSCSCRCFPTLLFSRLCVTFPNGMTLLHVQCELLMAHVPGTACCLLLLASQHTLGAFRA